MKGEIDTMVEAYAATLASFLDGGGESTLKRAYELGRRALADGLGVLDLATVHARALSRIHTASPGVLEGARARGAVHSFFIEVLSPFEMVHRGFKEANLALRNLNETLEREAKRFAHAIHDEVGPLLVTVHLALEALAHDLPPHLKGRVTQVRETLSDIEDQMRSLSHELRPQILEDLGLVPALRFLAEGISVRAGVVVEVLGTEEDRLPPAVETALYRVVQEALLNVGKHARATRAVVRLSREPQRVQCFIADDGAGMPPNAWARRSGKGGLGLVGMRERLDALGGSLEINSAPGQGTELRVTVPLEA